MAGKSIQTGENIIMYAIKNISGFIFRVIIYPFEIIIFLGAMFITLIFLTGFYVFKIFFAALINGIGRVLDIFKGGINLCRS